jgi:hypothetical protein
MASTIVRPVRVDALVPNGGGSSVAPAAAPADCGSDTSCSDRTARSRPPIRTFTSAACRSSIRRAVRRDDGELQREEIAPRSAGFCCAAGAAEA